MKNIQLLYSELVLGHFHGINKEKTGGPQMENKTTI